MSPELLLFLTEAVVKGTDVLDNSVYAIMDSKTLTYVRIEYPNMVIYLNTQDHFQVVYLNQTYEVIEQLQYFNLAVEFIEYLHPGFDLTWIKEHIALVDVKGEI